MIVGTLKITLHLPYNHSLKEKRRALKSLLSRVQSEFNVAAAEVDGNDLWQVAHLGFACVTNDSHHATEILSRIVGYIERSRPDVQLVDYSVELISIP